MGLADRIQEIDDSINKKKCAYALMVQSMTEPERKALQEAWDNGVSGRIILRALRAEGYKTSNEAILGHKSGSCKCPS